jgi:hypothetical protein
MGLMQDAENLGEEIRLKREAKKLLDKQVEEAKQEAIKKQEQHEEDKRHGMI